MSVSNRDIEARREIRAYIENETAKQRFEEDKEQYQKYRNQFDADQRRLPPAFQIEPLTLDAFRSMMPNEADPALRAAEAVAKSLWTEAATIEREQVLHGRDSQLFISPELAAARMSRDKAQAFNAEQVRRFCESTPEYFQSDANLEALIDYFQRNQLPIVNAAMFRAAFERLRSFGAIQERPTPRPEPEIQPESESEIVTSLEPEVFIGIDPDTGRQREYTQREVDKMTADRFKRCFEITRDRRIEHWSQLDALGRLQQ